MATSAAQNQPSQDVTECLQSIARFFHPSQYIKYQLDEVLPGLGLKLLSTEANVFYIECNELLNSIKNFTDKNISERELQILKGMHGTDKSEKQGYYCELCFHRTLQKEDWENHLLTGLINFESSDLNSPDNTAMENHGCTGCNILTQPDTVLNSESQRILNERLATTASPNQTSQATTDCIQTISRFLHLSQYTRYLLDEVLPCLSSKAPSILANEFYKECSYLHHSIKNFTDKNIPERDREDIRKRQATGKPKMLGYYCALCNCHAFQKEYWENHLADQIHSGKNVFEPENYDYLSFGHPHTHDDLFFDSESEIVLDEYLGNLNL